MHKFLMILTGSLLCAVASAEPSPTDAKAEEKIKSALIYTCALKKFCTNETLTDMDKKIIENAKTTVPPSRSCDEIKEVDHKELVSGMKAIAKIMSMVGKSTCLSKLDNAARSP